MAKHRRKRNRTSSHHRRNYRRKRKNPVMSFSGHRRSSRRNYHRRRNPSIGGMSGSDFLKLGGGAVVGSMGSKFLTQLVLGSGNTGVMGYGAQGVATAILAWAASKFAGTDIAKGVAAGGIAAIFLRIWQEQIAQTSPASVMSGLGDPDVCDHLGAYISSGFPVPTVSGRQGNYLFVPPNAGVTSSAGGAGASAAMTTGAPPVSRPVGRYSRY